MSDYKIRINKYPYSKPKFYNIVRSKVGKYIENKPQQLQRDQEIQHYCGMEGRNLGIFL